MRVVIRRPVAAMVAIPVAERIVVVADVDRNRAATIPVVVVRIAAVRVVTPATAVRIVVIDRADVRDRRIRDVRVIIDDVRGEVVIVAALRHPAGDSGQHCLFVAAGVAHIERVVVPVTIEAVLPKPEWVTGDSRQHHAAAALIFDHEQPVVATPVAKLVAAATTHPGVVVRVDGVQHPNAAVGIGVQHDEVAVVLHPNLDPGVIASLVSARLVERDPHRRIVLDRRRRARRQHR